MANMLRHLSYFVTDFWPYLIIFLLSLILTLALLLIMARGSVKLKFKNIWLVLASTTMFLIILLVSGEAYFRYFYDASDSLGFLKINQKWHQRHVQLNGDFRRDREFIAAKKPNEIRIAVIGDSISFGYGIKNPQDRFASIIEEKLKSDGLEALVYNLSFSGSGSQQQINDYYQKEYLDFDLVIWQYYLNDIETPENSPGFETLTNIKDSLKIPAWINPALKQSYLLEFLYWRLNPTYSKTFKSMTQAYLKLYSQKELFNAHQQEIADFLTRLNQRKIPVIVIIFPFLNQPQYEAEADKLYFKMSQIFVTNKASSVINLKSYLSDYRDDQLMAGTFDNHPNEVAHRIAAEILYKQINQIILKNY